MAKNTFVAELNFNKETEKNTLSLFITAWKTIFCFSKCSEKMVFAKKSHWNVIFLVVYYLERWYFFFPENMILFYRRKMKDDLSQKKYTEIWYFLQIPRKDSLSKKNRAGIWSFLHYRHRWYFIPGKYDIFSLDGKWKMIVLKKYTEIWYFLYKC